MKGLVDDMKGLFCKNALRTMSKGLTELVTASNSSTRNPSLVLVLHVTPPLEAAQGAPCFGGHPHVLDQHQPRMKRMYQPHSDPEHDGGYDIKSG